MTPDDFELMAYVDGELDAAASKRVAEAIDADSALRVKVEALIESRAIAKAKLLAEAAGVNLGPIMTMSESGGPRPPQPVARGRAFAAEAADAPVPVARGEQEISATVNITWMLQ